MCVYVCVYVKDILAECMTADWMCVCGDMKNLIKKVNSQKDGKTYFRHIYESLVGEWNRSWMVCCHENKIEILSEEILSSVRMSSAQPYVSIADKNVNQ